MTTKMFNFNMNEKIYLIGDVHGDHRSYAHCLIGKHNTIQVGDFGLGFINPHTGEDRTTRRMTDAMNRHAGNHYFIRGNHDNPKTCRGHSRWIPDGLIENGVMFIGGASSVDRAARTEGFDWWEDEELTMSEFYKLMDIYEKNKPEIMITHDAPTEIAARLWKPWFEGQGASITNQALSSMFGIHKPKQWFFGHHHVTWEDTIDGCHFRCLNIGEVTELKL